MSQFIKTHRRAFSLVMILMVLLAACVAIVVFRSLSSSSVRAQPTIGNPQVPTAGSPVVKPGSASLSVADAENLGLMRAELGLSDEALVGIGADEATADAVLSLTLDLARRHGAELDRVKTEEWAKRQALREAYAAMHQGNPTAGSSARIRTARRDLEQAESAREQLRTQLAASATAAMTFEQRARWQAARTNQDLPPEYRYTPGLSDADRSAIKTHLRQAQVRNFRMGASAQVPALPGRIQAAAADTERLMSENADGVKRSLQKLTPSSDSVGQPPSSSREPAR